MTQVTNLAANLTANLTAKVGDSKDKQQDMAQAVMEQFESIMNQNSKNMFESCNTYQEKSDTVVNQVITDFTEKDYVRLNQGKREIAQAKPEKELSSDVKFAEKVAAVADKVKDTVKETLQVSDEELETAMETLGFTPVDLLDPQKLIRLAQELTGSEDAGALLVNADFQFMMQEISDVITQFEQENSLTHQQFTDLVASLHDQLRQMYQEVKEPSGQVDTTPESGEMQEIVQSAASSEEPAAEKTGGMDLAQVNEDPGQGIRQESVQSNTAAAVHTQEPAGAQETPITGEEAAGDEQVMIQPEDELAEQTQSDSNQTFSKNGQKEQNKSLFSQSLDEQTSKAAAQTMMNDQPLQNVTADIPVRPAAVPQVASYTALQQLMEQVEGIARAFASTEGTTIEMQLNPESLGRLFLTVSEKQGNVTAQIAASNEQVKETLQTQMVELRATLQAQGIKVDAVEVTVATHEFEQNLDGNTSANGHMQERADEQAAQAQNTRRNLNMNSLDELTGLMSEEETLVAQMMRDNGGTVDFTA